MPAGSHTVTVSDSSVTMPLTDVPIYVGLDGTTIDYGAVDDPFTGLAFADAGGNALPFDVATWNPTGTSDVWVLTSLAPTSTGPTQITMTFGDHVGNASPSDVWAQYQLVAHLDDTTDASAHQTPGVSSGTPKLGDGIGVIGGGLQLDGAGMEGVTFPAGLFDSWPRLTLSYWVFFDYTTVPATEPTILGPLNSSVSSALLASSPPLVDVSLAFGAPSGTMLPLARGGATLQQWNWVAVTYDPTSASSPHLFINGMSTANSVNLNHAPLAVDTSPFTIGSPTSMPTINGRIDEVWAGSNATPDEAILATYHSIHDGTVTFGP